MTASQANPITANIAFRTLSAARVCSLPAMGLITVEMSLVAGRIGGVATARQILGFFFAVKIPAYVSISPLDDAFLLCWLRQSVTAELDAVRMLLLLPMSFASLLALRPSPAADPLNRAHDYPKPSDHHPHLQDVLAKGPSHRHTNAYYVDELH